MMVGELGLETINFGITCYRTHKDNLVKLAVDHAFTNKPKSIHSYYKSPIDYSDHSMICVEMSMNISKFHKSSKIVRLLGKF